MRGMSLVHVMGRLFNTPLLVTQEQLEVVVGAFQTKLAGGDIRAIFRLSEDDEDYDAPRSRSDRQDRRPYQMSGSSAIIPICRTLVHRDSGMDAFSGMTSYQRLRSMIDVAMRDEAVTGLLLDIDSGGGEAAGNFALGHHIRACSKIKPIVAFINEKAASAAYSLAAGAQRIVIPRTGLAGSIGAVLAHVDESQAQAQEGLVYTYIHAGERKTDTYPIPLTAAAKASLQSLVDGLYNEFVSYVAAVRPGMTQSMVRETEAAIFQGKDAVKLGLADQVGTFEDALALLQTQGAKRPGLAAAHKDAGSTRREMNMGNRVPRITGWGALPPLLPPANLADGDDGEQMVYGEGALLSDPGVLQMQQQLEAQNRQIAAQQAQLAAMQQQAARQTRREAQNCLRDARDYVDKTLLASDNMQIAPNGRPAMLALCGNLFAIDNGIPVRFYQGAMTDATLAIENHPTGVAFEIGGERSVNLMSELREAFSYTTQAARIAGVMTSEHVQGDTQINLVNPEAQSKDEQAEADHAANVERLLASTEDGKFALEVQARKNGGTAHAGA